MILSPRLSSHECSSFPDHVAKAQSKRQLPNHQHFTDYSPKESVIGTASKSAEVRDHQSSYPLIKRTRDWGWGTS